MLLERSGVFAVKPSWDRILGHVFPNGLLGKDGEEHRHHRKLMQQAVKRSHLPVYAATMNPMIAEDRKSVV